MKKPAQAQNPVDAAAASGVMLYASVSELPQLADGVAPEWIGVFPRLGKVDCRDGRTFRVNGAALIEAFRADGLKLPIDVNHATDLSSWTGVSGEAHGWITDLRVRDGALEAKVDWLESGRELLASRKYIYTSPSFYSNQLGDATRLRALALVTSPALGNQPALAAAQHPHSERPMKTLITALGLGDSADEAAMLAAVTELKGKVAGAVPKAVHEQTLADLSAASKELADLRAATRKEKVETLLEGALSARKILPAEREHYAALCSSDDGLAAVEKLLAAKTALFAGSGVEDRGAPGEGDGRSAVELASAARKLMEEGKATSIAEAMGMVTAEH